MQKLEKKKGSCLILAKTVNTAYNYKTRARSTTARRYY